MEANTGLMLLACWTRVSDSSPTCIPSTPSVVQDNRETSGTVWQPSEPLAGFLELALTLSLDSAATPFDGKREDVFFFSSRKPDSCSSGQQTQFSERTVNFWTCVSNRSGGFGGGIQECVFPVGV